MSRPQQYWLNVDGPNNTATIHLATCNRVLSNGKPPYKGIEALEKNGGWFSFSTIEDAEARARSEFGTRKLIKCKFCLG